MAALTRVSAGRLSIHCGIMACVGSIKGAAMCNTEKNKDENARTDFGVNLDTNPPSYLMMKALHHVTSTAEDGWAR